MNTVHPGFIETEMTASAAPAFREANIRETPLARTGSVDEMTPAGGVPALRRRRRSSPAPRSPSTAGLTAHGGAKSISDALRSASD
ncbi:hypothetical protein SALBM311S_03227 [Streptomyces alboniger]